ncbi:hypothetical protein SAMN05877809_106204 [Rhodobacter sp. JA431]|nr:hypothetical protein [Rhodobacter sp. JA431]SOC13135.1 hypothetical protein SAMN05877809_106204 [Rhodobacter sp. JA431]
MPIPGFDTVALVVIIFVALRETVARLRLIRAARRAPSQGPASA